MLDAKFVTHTRTHGGQPPVLYRITVSCPSRDFTWHIGGLRIFDHIFIFPINSNPSIIY